MMVADNRCSGAWHCACSSRRRGQGSVTLALLFSILEVGSGHNNTTTTATPAQNDALEGFPSTKDLAATSLNRGGGSNQADTSASPDYPTPPPNPWPNAAWCTGDVVMASVSVASAVMTAMASYHDCTAKPDTEKCTRDIFGTIRNFDQAATSITHGLETCGGQSEKCALAIETMIGSITTVGEAAAQMADVCPSDKIPVEPLNKNWFSCGSLLEKVGWFLDPLATNSDHSLRSCGHGGYTKNKYLDVGACVGESLASAAYIAGAGMQIAFVAEACDPTYLKINANDKNAAARCSVGVTSVLRALATAASKADRAAGHCGGIDTLCGRDISRMAAALFGAASYSAETFLSCQPPDLTTTPTKCGAAGAGLVKELAVVSAKATDAVQSCEKTNFANLACGSGVSKAIAALAFATQEVNLAVTACNPQLVSTSGLWACKTRVSFIGQAIQFVSMSIGNAVVDCGLNEGAPRKSVAISLPKGFFV